MIRLCFTKLLKPLLAKAKDFKKYRAALKRQREAELRSKLSTHLPAIKHCLKLAMIDLHNVVAEFIKKCDGDLQPPGPALRFALDVWICALAFLNSLGGRPGGWEKLPMSAFTEMMASGCNYMIAKDHKTVMVHGPLPLNCPPGNQKAFGIVHSLPLSGSGKFLEPPGWTAEHGPEKVYCTKALQFFLTGYMTDAIIKEFAKEAKLLERGFKDVSCTSLRRWQTSHPQSRRHQQCVELAHLRGWLQSPPGTAHYHLCRLCGLRWHSRWCVLEKAAPGWIPLGPGGQPAPRGCAVS